MLTEWHDCCSGPSAPRLFILTSVRREGDCSRDQLHCLRPQQSSDVGPWRPSWISLCLSQTRSRIRLSSQPDYVKRSSAVRLCRDFIVVTTSQTLFFLYSNYAVIHFVNYVLVKVTIFGQFAVRSSLNIWILWIFVQKTHEDIHKTRKERN